MTAKTTSKPYSSFTQSNPGKSEQTTSKQQDRHTSIAARRRSANADMRRMRVVGYVRVSTEQQVQEGVSLDAQRTRIKAHCISQGLALVDIIVDDGYSAASLKRPGLRAALRMFDARKADAIVVLKLNRLTRSVKDLGYLCDTYFREGLPFYLLSVCDSIDTRSAGGKLILNVLMSVAQWEREAISSANFRAANLASANLFRANLANANFRNAKLGKSHLRDANLSDADLSDADLFGASLDGTNLRGAKLVNANLEEADLSNADLIRADLTDARLNKAKLSSAALVYANLTNAKLKNAILINAALMGAKLPNADLMDADLTSANLTHADLRYTNFRGANLTNADLTNADLTNTKR